MQKAVVLVWVQRRGGQPAIANHGAGDALRQFKPPEGGIPKRRKVTMAVLIHKAGGHQTAIYPEPRESIGQVGRNGRDPPFFHQDIGAGRRACRAVTNDPAAENPLFH